MGDEVGEPSRVIDVGLAARGASDVFGIGEHQHEIAVIEDIPDRLPVDPCRLHGDVRDAEQCQPLRKVEKVAGRGLERADLAHDLAVNHAACAGDHRLLVDIEASAMRMQDFHDRSSNAPPAWSLRLEEL